MILLPDIVSAIAALDHDQLPALLAAIAARMASARLPDAHPEVDELLDAKKAATMLGISTSHLHHTDFPFAIKIGHSKRFSRNGIQRYIEKKQRKA